MAFVLADAVAKKMGEMAVQPMLNEVSMLSNFAEDFEWLQSIFMEINCVLNEANEDSSRQKDSAKNWLHRVRDISWEAEDILEECAVNSLYTTNAQFFLLNPKQLIFRHEMGTRIRKVKDAISSVAKDGKLLNIVRSAVPPKEAESSRTSEGQQQRWSSPSDSKPEAIQSKIKSVVRLLENPESPIIVVVGMGGIGKTYLLQHVYNSEKERYYKSAWLSVSQFYSVSQLQRDLAFQLDEGLYKKISKSKISETLVAESIHNLIQGKRCLFVLDDVWRATIEDNLLTKLGIPTKETSQCKILVSTRNREAFKNLKAKNYEMKLLTEKESWMLFCAHAFPEFEGNRAPKELEEVAHEIMKKCGGLPLAIKIAAASLARTTLPIEWEYKLSKLEKVGTSEDLVMDILKLSYHSLPAHLKACFAYLSIFPEDEVIEFDYLVHLWMGEGLIPAGENPWDCLDQLVNLCLVEGVEEEWRLNKYCKVHDLLLDLAILVSRENRCAFSIDDVFSKLHSPHTAGGRWCRLFFAKKDIDEHAISDRHLVTPRLVRTVSLSRNTKIGGNIPERLFNGMRVLRVLDLSYSSISALPASVGKMKLLKVLNLSGTKIENVPDPVRRLKSLIYLNLSGCGGLKRSLEAPKWISELQCLQHLEGPFEQLPNGISKLESLRTVRISGEWWLSLSMEEEGMLGLEDVGNMRQIEEIRFKVEYEPQLKMMEEGVLAPLSKMRRLDVKNKITGMRSDLPQFSEKMSAMSQLKHLRLEYFVVPSWIGCLKNLMFLFLQNCDCSDYPELQAMPNLVSLWLDVNRRCTQLPEAFGKSGGFPHLRFLSIHNFPELQVFPEIEDGGMARLEKLELWDCRNVNKAGEGLQRLKNLKEISFRYSGTHKLRETFKEGGIYWQKIKQANSEIIIKVSM